MALSAADPRRLDAPPGTPFPFAVEVQARRAGAADRPLTLASADLRKTYRLSGESHDAWLDLYAEVARDFGTRPPLNRAPPAKHTFEAPLQPLLTGPLGASIRYGYGDPAVIRTPDGYHLVVTSNDAADAFPILGSPDLESWQPEGFVFPKGQTPAWSLVGEGVADFWAPEMHRVGAEYWVCFCARGLDHTMSIGLAKADRPQGPFHAAEAPLIGGGMIDPHILIDRDGAPILIWKADANAVWPRRLAELLQQRPDLIAPLFPDERDRRTASLTATLQPWLSDLSEMQQFFLLQPMIEAAAEDFTGFRARVGALQGRDEPRLKEALAEILDATVTHIWAQRLSPDGNSLVGPRTSILQNDLHWEAHLIEGPWISEVDGRFWMFYAGNDFSTEHYGIGAAVADHPLGPYRKLAEPLLRSTADWRGPGHPSVTRGPEGELRMLLHAFGPGAMGYGVFRALLSTRLAVEGDSIRVV